MSADAENLDQTAYQNEGERDRPADDGLDADAKAEEGSVAVRRVRQVFSSQKLAKKIILK